MKLPVLLLGICGFAMSVRAADYHVNTPMDIYPGNKTICSARAAAVNASTASLFGTGGEVNEDCPAGGADNTMDFDKAGGTVYVTQGRLRFTANRMKMHNGVINRGDVSALFGVYNSATLEAEMMVFEHGNANDGSGGAGEIANNARFKTNRVTFAKNTALTDGGGLVSNTSGEVALKDSYFTGNVAKEGGGGGMSLGGSNSPGQFPAYLQGVKFWKNRAKRRGGGLDCSSASQYARVLDGNFLENNVEGYLDGAGKPAGYGGGVASDCRLELLTTRLRGNIADVGRGGGAYFGAGSNSTVLDSYFDKNQAGASADAPGVGGAMAVDGELHAIRVSIAGNGATTRAGGVEIGDGAQGRPIQIANATFDSNNATSNAGAVKKPGGALWVSGADFAPDGLPDPVYGYGNYKVMLLNDTFVDNAGTEQIFLGDGKAQQLLFVNNVVKSARVPGCGGAASRLKVQRDGADAAVFNLQFPGQSCSTQGAVIDEFSAPIGGMQHGGLLDQAYRYAPDPVMEMTGDIVICDHTPVNKEDQLRNDRACLLGAVEVPRATNYPAWFHP